MAITTPQDKMITVLKHMGIVAQRILTWSEEIMEVGVGAEDHVLNVGKMVTGVLIVLEQITETVMVTIRAGTTEVGTIIVTIASMIAAEIPGTLKMGLNNHILMGAETVKKQVPAINVASLGTGVQVVQRQVEDISGN